MAAIPKVDTFWIGGATNWSEHPTPGLRTLSVTPEGHGRLGPAERAGGNPTFVSVLPDGNLVVVNEIHDGQVSLYSPSGNFATRFSSAPTGSADPTHLTSLPDGSHIVAANYSGGAVTVHERRPLCIKAPLVTVQYEGSGPTPRQESPHPHQVVVYEADKSILVPDLGMDVIHVHSIDDLLQGNPRHRDIPMAPGCGPRHLIVQDHTALVVCELDNTVRAMNLQTGEELSVAAASTTAGSLPSAIRMVDPNHVLVGNRGPDTISVLQWKDGQLTYLGESGCGGKHPRDFALTADRKHVVVANLHSNNLAILRYHPETTSLEVVDTLETASPTCASRIR